MTSCCAAFKAVCLCSAFFSVAARSLPSMHSLHDNRTFSPFFMQKKEMHFEWKISEQISHCFGEVFFMITPHTPNMEYEEGLSSLISRGRARRIEVELSRTYRGTRRCRCMASPVTEWLVVCKASGVDLSLSRWQRDVDIVEF